MSVSPPPSYDSRSTPYSTTTLKPYLQLPHLLSLTWLAYPIISLLFVAFRLQLSSASAQSSVADAKADLLSSCQAAQRAATSTASLPRYLATTANAQFSDAVNDLMDAARATMVIALTIMEAIINFVIDTYRSTFLCFLELVVRGALNILISAVQEISNFVDSTLGSIRTSIQNDVATANSGIQKAVDAINKVNPFGNISVPQFSIPSLSALQNVTLPDDFENALIKLNNSLPTLSQLKSDIDNIVDKPFELLKQEINSTFEGLHVDVSVLPVPEQNTLSFCDQMDTSVVDDLGHDLVKIAKIGTVLLVVLALLLLASNCAFEWYKWRLLKKHLQNTREAWTSDPTIYHVTVTKSAPTVDLSDHNLLLLQVDQAHPFLTKLANQLLSRLHLSPSQHTHLRFFFHYIFHPPALACFLIGFFGILSVQIQIIAVGPLARKYSEQAVASTQDFTDLIASSINNTMYNQSIAYANEINARVETIQSSINDGMFGWVNGTTTTLNNTVAGFYSDIQDAINVVFNGTIFDSPIQEFLKCFLGSKVDAIEKALTFLNQNLHVDIPTVNETVLVLTPAQINEASAPIAQAAIGGGSNNSTGVVGKLVNTYISSLAAERIVFGIFMGIWAVVVLMALCIIFWHSYGVHWVEAYRKRKWKKEQRCGINGLAVPFRDRSTTSFSSADTVGQPANADLEKSQVDLPSFTPMPSPRPRQGLFSPKQRSTVPSTTDPAQHDALKPHPLSIRRPAFEKSWDSFLDHVRPAPPIESDKVSGPRKLMAIGRKAMGRERFVSDEDKTHPLAQVQSAETTAVQPWYKRFAGALWVKDSDSDEGHPEMEERASDSGSVRAKIRPQLTISTAHTSKPDPRLPKIEMTSPDAEPVSAWSVSPGPPPKQPWLMSMPPAKKPSVPAHPAFHQKSRPAAGVPSDIDPGRDSLMPEPRLAPPAPAPGFAPLPLYHGFNFPPPPSRTAAQRTLAPPPLHLSLSHSPAVNPDTSTPVTRLLTTTHARKSSQAVDPFATPFDDENSVDPHSAGGNDASTPTNPFVVTAF
ncbi:hypothetical protein CERSUDRAFT_113973 [Gelatoporia subvermispora B]|uniref:Plasma membrane fusion protein PRM1 n=1 Tax=Ceriporiopsis subvermispora (strain B) TaxID=914234 RepID=M2QYU5_CERS8|nr:hypothetical protein CERSUDRAFT_113973 [Gelatoporia subvermispora B]